MDEVSLHISQPAVNGVLRWARGADPDQFTGRSSEHSHALFTYASAAVSMVSPEPKCGPPPVL